jgi:cation:H+ antiporter
MSILLLLGGLVLLVMGADLLVRGAAGLALSWGVSHLVVGLTVVAFGTSAPEVAVSVRAALEGQADIAIGNVIGSNLFNVLIILGLAAVVTPLAVSRDIVRRDIPIMLGFSALLALATSTGRIDWRMGAAMLGCLVVYTGALVWSSRRAGKAAAAGKEVDADAPKPIAWWKAVLLVAVGLVMLVYGAGWLVDGAVMIAKSLGVSELVIGLTIVAAGTSFPELATSVVAAIRGQRDIAVGNVIGSNTFNLLGVLGAAGVASGTAGMAIAPSILAFDLPLMIGICVLIWPICRNGYAITRAEGAFLVLGYILYTVALVLGLNPDSKLGGQMQIATWAWLGLGIVGSTALVLIRRGKDLPPA